MQLDSIYGLKRSVTRQLNDRGRTRAGSRGARPSGNFATFSLTSPTSVPKRTPLVGLGAVRKPGPKSDYLLAVRYENGHDPVVSQLVSDLHTQTKGEIDAQEIGYVSALNWYRQLNRPCLAGSSIMLDGVNGAGTLGAFVRRDGDDGVYVLSNSHVIADNGNATRGSAVVQPGPLDGGTPSHRIATLAESAAISFSEQADNNVDAAIARMDATEEATLGHIPEIGPLQGVADVLELLEAQEDVSVNKVGRTTGATSGYVSAVEVDVFVDYDGAIAKFANQIEIQSNNGQIFSGLYSPPGGEFRPSLCA